MSMSWESRYLPPDPTIWQGRADIPPNSCFYQRIKLLNLLEQQPGHHHEPAFAIVGFQCDEGVQRDLGRAGAAEGPTSIRLRLAKMPLQKPSLICYDAGDIVCPDHDLEASQQALAEMTALLLKNNVIPLVLGGGHEVSFGIYQGLTHIFAAQKKLGIINFDSHFDMQPVAPTHRGSATTTFYQIAMDHQAKRRHFDYNCIGIQHSGNILPSFEFAKSQHVRAIFADDLHQGLTERCVDFIDRVIDENDIVYISISLDVFSPAYAPGVSTIQPLGLTPWQIIPLLRQAATSGKVIAYDLAEHAPRYDVDHRTAKLAASLIYEIIHHHHEPFSSSTSHLV
jgi:formiminoglutamase